MRCWLSLLLLLLLLHTYGPCFLAILSALDDIPTQDTHTYIDTRHTTQPTCLDRVCMYASLVFPFVSSVSRLLNTFVKPGIALQELGELDEAASCYEKAIALSPDYVLAHYNLAYVRQDQVHTWAQTKQKKCTVLLHATFNFFTMRMWCGILFNSTALASARPKGWESRMAQVFVLCLASCVCVWVCVCVCVCFGCLSVSMISTCSPVRWSLSGFMIGAVATVCARSCVRSGSRKGWTRPGVPHKDDRLVQTDSTPRLGAELQLCGMSQACSARGSEDLAKACTLVREARSKNERSTPVVTYVRSGEAYGGCAALPGGGGPGPERRGHPHQPRKRAPAGRRIGRGDNVSSVLESLCVLGDVEPGGA